MNLIWLVVGSWWFGYTYTLLSSWWAGMFMPVESGVCCFMFKSAGFLFSSILISYNFVLSASTLAKQYPFVSSTLFDTSWSFNYTISMIVQCLIAKIKMPRYMLHSSGRFVSLLSWLKLVYIQHYLYFFHEISWWLLASSSWSYWNNYIHFGICRFYEGAIEHFDHSTGKHKVIEGRLHLHYFC